MKNISAPTTPTIVSRADWLAARQHLLAKEKDLTRLRDTLNAARRQMPWVQVEHSYVFEGARGKQTLGDLFDGSTQLIVYHFMFGDGWEEACKSCCYVMDHIDGALPHLKARDTSFVAVSKGPWSALQQWQQRMGWRFHWVSAHETTFNADFHVSFTKAEMEEGRVEYNYQTYAAGMMPTEELPGVSVFIRRGQDIFHTYSTYARGLDPLIGTYQWLDLTPKGRDEDDLEFSMAWVRYHDRYSPGGRTETDTAFAPPRGSICEPIDAQVWMRNGSEALAGQ